MKIITYTNEDGLDVLGLLHEIIAVPIISDNIISSIILYVITDDNGNFHEVTKDKIKYVSEKEKMQMY